MYLGIYRGGLRSRKCIDRRRATLTMVVCKDILTLFLAWMVAVTRCQSLPTRDEELFIHQVKHPETFHDTRLIPDGAEATGYALTDKVSGYFFVVEEDGPPLAITITPCASKLEWMLYLHDLPEEGSASGINDQLELQRMHWRSSSSSTKMGSQLKAFVGRNASTYTTSNSPAGIYILKVRATEKESSFQMYATTTPHSDNSYPVLPSDSRVDVTTVRKTRVSLAWKASLSSTVFLQPIIYCVAMNTERNFPTLCSINSRLHGDSPPIVPHTGFGFRHERGRKKSRKARKRKNRRKSQLNTAPEITDSDIVYECIGQKTFHTFANLKANKKYYIDIFAVDISTNRSTVYQGSEVTTRPGEEDEKIVTLKDGKMLDASLQEFSLAKTFQINVEQKTEELLVSVQPCTDPIVVEIKRDGKVLKSGIYEDLHSFTITNPKGTYNIRVSAKLKKTTHFRIFATMKSRKYPYPRMPDDMRIKPFRNLRKCDSVTLAWLTSTETAQYCLYKREDKSDKSLNDGKKNMRLDNTCHGPEMRKQSEKVLCRKLHVLSVHDTVMNETVTGLTKGTDYVFDVYVSKDGRQSLAYKSVKVKTKKYC